MLIRIPVNLLERRLEHENGEARTLYSFLPRPARIAVETTGNLQWFGRMLAPLGHELIIGDAAKNQGHGCSATENRFARCKSST